MTDITLFRNEHFFLSNMYTCPVRWNGINFGSSEHAYQASKSLNPEDWLRIAEIESPFKTKMAGRRLVTRPDWDDVKLFFMESILRIKFNGNLKHKLLSTGNRRLVEGNTWNDTFWGVCNGVGQNNLGKLLMKIRGELA